MLTDHQVRKLMKRLTAGDPLEVATTKAGMDPKNLLPSGAGENDPVSRDRAKNRRIEIALLPAISELPPLPASLGSDTAQPEAQKAEAPKPEPKEDTTPQPKVEENGPTRGDVDPTEPPPGEATQKKTKHKG